MAITQLDCFRATINHRPHAGILAHASFTPDLDQRVRKAFDVPDGTSISRHLGLYEPVYLAPSATSSTPKGDFAPYFKDVAIPPNARFTDFGTLRIPVGFYHFDELVCPLRHAETLDEIKAFPFPAYEGYDETHLADQVRQAHAEGRVTAGAVGHIFENAWQIRGMQAFLMDMLAAPENCEYILDRLFDFQMARACAMARAGVDYLHTGDDVATQQDMMFSLDSWRHFIKLRWAAIYAAARAIKPDIKIWYHSDGNIRAIIPELIEIGVDILNPIQPECLDPLEVKQRWGHDLVLDGCIGTQSVMPFGTPRQVRDTILKRMDEAGEDGALILAPTHILEPEVPLANIEAFVDTLREVGGLFPPPL